MNFFKSKYYYKFSRNPLSVFGLIIVALSGFAAVIGFYFYRIIAFVKFCFVGLKSFFVGLFIKK